MSEYSVWYRMPACQWQGCRAGVGEQCWQYPDVPGIKRLTPHPGRDPLAAEKDQEFREHMRRAGVVEGSYRRSSYRSSYSGRSPGGFWDAVGDFISNLFD